MFNKQADLDNLSVEELEQLLRIKQRKQRQERFTRLAADGASRNAALLAGRKEPLLTASPQQPLASNAGLLHTPQKNGSAQQATTPPASPKSRGLRDKFLLFIEIGAVIGLIVVLVSSYLEMRTLNSEMVAAQLALVTDNLDNPIGLPSIAQPVSLTEPSTAGLPFDRLPGGHSSPQEPGGAVPDIPAHLQNWVQPPPPVPVSEPIAAEATRIVIPKIDVDAPIVAGVTWEDLKKGVGHLPGSAQPGQRGNMYLAAHNDIFGEIFRHLDKLEEGDEFHVYAEDTKYTYVIREKRIIEPTDVEVMLPTTEPVATLQTCYPYLIDTHRLIVVADLVS